MAEIRFTHPDEGVVPWEPGAIVVLQVREVREGAYITDTLETFPADIVERHAAELAQVGEQLLAVKDQLVMASRQNEALVGRASVSVPLKDG